jgi:Cupin domain.
MDTLFSIPDEARSPDSGELFEILLQGGNGLLVERIISHGHTTPEGEWYDQEKDEWVAVLQGEATLLFADGREVFLGQGMHVFLPRHEKHRVTHTSSPCIWLAIHGSLCVK